MPSTVHPLRRRSSNPVSGELNALAIVLREEFDAAFRFYDAASGDLVDVPGTAEQAPPCSAEERALVLRTRGRGTPRRRRPG